MREFIASERCDRCGAQAYHVVTKPGFSELLLCNHHEVENHDKLLDTGWTIVSDVSSVIEKHTNRNETNEVR